MMTFVRSLSSKAIFIAAFGTLAIASCVSADRTGDDQTTDEDGSVQDQAYSPVCQGGKLTCKSYVHVDSTNRIKAHAVPSGLGPTDLTSAYKLSASKTSTATIAIVDAFNYPNAASDLAQYRSTYGLPPCTVANGCFKVLNQNGATSPLPANAPSGDDWTVEAALDLDLASAACPTCKIILFEANSDQDMSLYIAQNAAAATAGVTVISNSWGGPSDGNDASYDSQYFTHSQAVNTFIASGDSGNTGATPDYPSTSLKVIGVGGTTLTKASGTTRGWTETVWSGAGSSCSKTLAKPSYQSVVSTTACAKRAASDVSAVANPSTGLAVYNVANGGWIVVGGTSAASPFVAGVWARYGLPAPHDASYPYGHTSEFFDITSGSNGSCSSALCKAAAGWDGPTGIGTPNGATLGGGSTCTPVCSGKTCGDDGCGGTCGTCAAGQTCSASGTCTGGGSTCTHSECTSGAKLKSGCDTCVTSICAADSFCCSSSWDSICVGEVSSVCHQTCN
ncbi:MAG TPA: S53 family peptidase [Kofleriaceae bacterium]